MGWIVELIDRVLTEVQTAALTEHRVQTVITAVRDEVNREMVKHPLFAY